MSFLEELDLKKRSLRHTKTIVTRADGRCFIEHNNESIPLDVTKLGFVVDTKPDSTPACIAENLYLGSQDCLEPNILAEHKIKRILSIGIKPSHIQADVLYKFVECLDLPETNITNVLTDCIPFIQKALRDDSSVLVHCNAGVSRSAAVVIGFLMLDRGLPFRKAHDVVKAARSCVRPNAGFERQLKLL